jgi:hypothetical protein
MMTEIIKYLKNPVSPDNIKSLEDSDLPIVEAGYRDLSKENPSIFPGVRQFVQKNIKPINVSSGQIWLLNRIYIDSEGSEIKGSIPYYALIITNPQKIGEMEFVRVQTISSFTDFATVGDILIEDESIVGFKCFVETWNEQPINVKLLEEYIDNINIDEYQPNSDTEINSFHREFREQEIRNTGYLRHSVTSYLSWEEKKQSKDGGVVINIDGQPYYPHLGYSSGPSKGYNLVAEPSPVYSIAAKAGFDELKKYFKYEGKLINVQFSLLIKRENNLFSIILKNIKEFQLLGPQKKEYFKAPISGHDEALIENLPPGTYSILIEGSKEKIRMRLK